MQGSWARSRLGAGHAQVADSPRHAFPIEPLEERDGVLARDSAAQLFELDRAELAMAREVLADAAFEVFDRGRFEEETSDGAEAPCFLQLVERVAEGACVGADSAQHLVLTRRRETAARVGA